MPETPENTTKKKIGLRNISFKKLNRSYDFLMRHDESKKEILGFKLNLLNLILVIIGLALLLIVINTFIIAFTPLREYIPGYADNNLEREIYELSQRAESLSAEMEKKNVYFDNLRRVVEGYPFEADSSAKNIDIYKPLPALPIDSLKPKKSVRDSLLRSEFEAQNQYNLFGAPRSTQRQHGYFVKNFFIPVEGHITAGYNPQAGHFGIDIVSDGSQVIKAALDGTVVFSSWSIENGYSIGLQHEDSYFSVYKHNATLLKKEGDFVKAGEAIAILGKSGEESHETHLHFELWHNGIALNPSDYMMIENNATDKQN